MNYFKTLWMTLQCPPYEVILADAYKCESADEAIEILNKWIPYLCDHDKKELYGLMSYDMAFYFDKNTWSDKLFAWLEESNPL